MQRNTPPPIGYYITDFEKEIQKICAFLEAEGMKYILMNEFEIRYVSDSLHIIISFERYGETVWVDYRFPKKGDSGKEVLTGEEYSIGWTIAEYKNGNFQKKYLNKNMSKLEEISAYMQFFKDYRELLLDESFAQEMRTKYNKLGF